MKLNCWGGRETLPTKPNLKFVVYLQAKTSYNGLYLKEKAHSDSDSSAV